MKTSSATQRHAANGRPQTSAQAARNGHPRKTQVSTGAAADSLPRRVRAATDVAANGSTQVGETNGFHRPLQSPLCRAIESCKVEPHPPEQRISNSTKLQAIEYDERMACANTINRFIESNPNDREVLLKIFTNAETINALIKGGNRRFKVQLPKALVKNIEKEKLNDLLHKLSINIHLETGCNLFRLEVTSINEDSLTLTRRKINDNFRSTTLIDHKIGEITLRNFPNPTDEFRDAVLGETPYVSLFKDTMKNVGFITHNRNQVVETIDAFAENFISFGHGDLKLYVLDDSNDEGLQDRKIEIEKLKRKYAQKGIKIIFFGKEKNN